MHLTGLPDDQALVQAIAQALANLHPHGQAWAVRYRARQPLFPVLSAEVPHWRRVTGEVRGPELRLTKGEISHDGQTWTEFPLDAPRYQVTHWQEGRIDIEPDPPEDDLDTLEDAARAHHGEKAAPWQAAHRKLQPQGEVPQAKRTVFELRPEGYQPLSEHAAYSLDGEHWRAYDPRDGETEQEQDQDAFGLFDNLFGGMLDVATVPVTVYADGRVEWAEGDIPAEHAGRIRADLIQATGAGNAEAWADWTSALLAETFASEMDVGDDAPLPVPQAVRLDIAQDAIDDPDPLAQTFMESEVSFDGITWRDLFGEELPPELERFSVKRSDL